MSEDIIDFDDVLPHIGEFGRYQWYLFFYMAPFCINLVLIYFPHIFMTLEPTHWCKVPELTSLQPLVRRSLISPTKEDGRLDGCQQFDVNYTRLLADYNSGLTVPDQLWPTKECTDWEYDYSDVGNYPSIVSEYNWVCGKSNYAANAQSIFFVGAIFGGLIAGWLADKYGRIPVLVATNVVGALSCLLISSASSFTEYAIYKFIGGMAFDNIFVMIYVLALEYFAPQHRTIVANVSIAVFYTLGTVVLPWVAIALGDWRLLSAVCSVPMLLGSGAYFFVPESVRWLMSQGLTDESIEITKKIAKVNGKIIPDDIIKRMKKSNRALDTKAEDEEEDGSLLDLYKTPVQLRTVLLVALFWMLVNLSYDGHIRNVLNLPINIFIIFTVACATELPADLLLTVTLDRWGRRWYGAGTMVLSGVFTLLVIAMPDPNEYWLPIFFMAILGRFCVNIAFNIGLQYAAEILPTVVRAQGVSAIHIAGYVAALVSPQIVQLGTESPFLPTLILGVLAIIAGGIALFLPETLNADLPNTLSEGEKFCRSFKFLSFPCGQQPEEDAIGLEDAHTSPQASFIRRRAMTRGESYRSSMLARRRRDNIYLPPPQS